MPRRKKPRFSSLTHRLLKLHERKEKQEQIKTCFEITSDIKRDILETAAKNNLTFTDAAHLIVKGQSERVKDSVYAVLKQINGEQSQ